MGLSACVLASPTASAQSLTAEVKPRALEVGEAARLTLELTGATPRGRPSVEAGPAATLGYEGATNAFRSDGRTMRRSVQYGYALAFEKPGRYEVRASVRTDRGEVRSDPVTVTVKAAGERRDVLVLASIEPRSVYVNQPAVCVFEFCFAREVKGYRVRIPFLEDIPGARLLDPERLAERWDESARKTGRGLAGYDTLTVADAGVKAVARVSKREIEGVPYTVYTVRRALIASEPARHELGKAAATANVVVGTRRARDPFFDEGFGFDPFADSIFSRRRHVTKTLTASSGPLALEVLPLPEEGRPAGFEGAVGSFSLAAKASPRETALGGSPIMLTLVVEGEGNLETVGLPALADESGFRAGSPEQDSESRFEGGRLVGEKRFTLPLRPRRADVREVPRARLVVFDPRAKRYVTLTSDPITVEVTVPEDTGAIESMDLPPAPDELRRPAQPLRRDIEDVATGLDEIESHEAWLHRPGGILLVAIFPLGVFAGLFVYANRLKTLREDRALARRLSAAGTVRRRLEETRAGRAGDAAAFTSELSRALQSYVADRAGRGRGEIPPAEAEELLAGSGCDEEAARSLAALLSEAEAARFAGERVDRAELLDRAFECVEALEKGGRS
jgi:hypothetical protein